MAAGICRLTSLIVLGAVTGLVCIGGLLGNVILLVVMATSPRKTATTTLLSVAAVMDIGILVTIFINFSVHNLCVLDWIRLGATTPFCTGYIDVRMALIFYLVPINTLTMTGSSYIVTVVTYIRFIAICFPLKAYRWGSRRVAYALMLPVLLISLALSVPRYWAANVAKAPNSSTWLMVETKYSETAQYRIGLRIVTSYFVGFAFPVFSVLIFTAMIIRGLRRRCQLPRHVYPQRDAGNGKTSSHDDDVELSELVAPPAAAGDVTNDTNVPPRDHAADGCNSMQRVGSIRGIERRSKEVNQITHEETQITKSLVTIAVIFLLYQLVYVISRIMSEVIPSQEMDCPHPYVYFSDTALLLAAVNASSNFFVLLIFTKFFKEQLRKLFKVSCRDGRLACDCTYSAGYAPTRNDSSLPDPATLSRVKAAPLIQNGKAALSVSINGHSPASKCSPL